MKFLLIVLFCCSLSTLSFAIQCYQCVHQEHPNDDGVPNDADCKWVNDKYKIECTKESNLGESFKHPNPNIKSNATLESEKRQGQPIFSCHEYLLIKEKYTEVRRGCVYYKAESAVHEDFGEGKLTIRVCNTEGCNNTNASNNVFSMSIVTLLIVCGVVIRNS